MPSGAEPQFGRKLGYSYHLSMIFTFFPLIQFAYELFRFGRRTMTLTFAMVPMGFRLLQIFAPTLPLYVTASFFVAAGYMAIYITTFSLGKSKNSQ